jgi:hypothetical protein
MNTTFLISLISISVFLLSSCKEDKPEDIIDEGGVDCSSMSIDVSTNVKGYNILAKVPGIWNGPITSPTPLGNFPEYIVDFRPISASQVAAKNELDSINDIFMSFFIVKHNCEYKVAFRNGGGFAGQTRNSYQLIDSVSETSGLSFYRFVDPVAGKTRVYTDVTFKPDSMIIHVYTNQYNTLSTAQTHMIWRAKLQDQTSAQNAISLFNFPQKLLTRDFTTTFDGSTEAIYYSTAQDPYPENQQPYLGNSTVNVNVTNPAVVDPSKKILISITTQPLFPGNVFSLNNMKYRTRYVFVDAEANTSFNFNYMHPGTYYVNAIYDSNGDFNFSSGDYMNFPFDVPLTLTNQGSASVNVNVNYPIP